MLFHEQFVRVAKEHESKLAIIDRTMNRLVTYKRALIGALILARKFRTFEPGFLGIMLPNSAGAILSVLGTLMSGRVPVMINYSTGAAANCEYAQQKCAFKTIVTSRAVCEKIGCSYVPGMVYIEDLMKSVTFLEKVFAGLKAGRPIERLLREIHIGNEDDTMLILFTSGSEKDPKAVQLSHRNIYSNHKSLSKAFGLSADDVMLANLPFFHVFGQTANIWVPLALGMK